jgi:hypothetical protein
MANTITLSAQDNLVNSIITKFRKGGYKFSQTEGAGLKITYLNPSIRLVETSGDKITKKSLFVNEVELTGKYVRRLTRAISNYVSPDMKTKVSRKKETVAQETINSLMDLI